MSDSTVSVDKVVADFNGHRAGEDFSTAVNGLLSLKQSDSEHFQDNLSLINQQVDFQSLGFGDDFQITGVEGDKLASASSDNQYVQVRNPSDLLNMVQVKNQDAGPATGPVVDAGSAVPAEGDAPTTTDAAPAANDGPVAFGDRGREMVLDADGVGSYIAKSGDNYWSVASDVLSSRNDGSAPSNTEIANYVNVLAGYNQKDDPNRLAIGETIKIPPAANTTAEAPASSEAQPQDPDSAQPAPSDTNSVVAPTDAAPAVAAPTDASSTDAVPTNAAPAEGAPLAATDSSTVSAPAAAGQPEKISPEPVEKSSPASVATADTPVEAPAAAVAPAATSAEAPAENPAAEEAIVDTPEPAATSSKPFTLVATMTGLAPNAKELLPRDDAYNFLAPAGHGEANFGEAFSAARVNVADRSVGNIVDGASGEKTASYTGTLNDGLWLTNWMATTYKGDETVDANGNLMHRDIQYEGGGKGLPSMTFLGPNDAPLQIESVKTIDTARGADGNYKTVVTDVYGEQWTAVTNANGLDISAEQTRDINGVNLVVGPM